MSEESVQPSMQRFRMTIAYDGTAFHGWQKQKAPPSAPDTEPPRTVAGDVEQAIIQALKQPITLVGASRTDTGVHAKGQVAHFDAATTIPDDRLALAINSRLPKDVDVLSIVPTRPDFHAIRHVERKQYRYQIFNSARRPLAMRHIVWHCWTTLETDRMNEAAKRLEGRHDFEGLCAADSDRNDAVRTIFVCRVKRDHPMVHIVVEGDGFLYHMVRIIAGTLVEVGRGRFEPEVIDRVLTSRDRSLAGPTLPPSGLCLEWIRYEQNPAIHDGHRCSETTAADDQ